MDRRTPEFIELLIESYKKHPALYDPRVPNYHNRDVRNAALESVAKELGDHGFTITANEVYSKFKSIRDQYVVKKRNSRLKEASGFPVQGIKWKYGNMLTWLDEFIGHRIQLPMQAGTDSACDTSYNYTEPPDYNAMETQYEHINSKAEQEEYLTTAPDMHSDDASYHGSGPAASENSVGSPKPKSVISSNDNCHSAGAAINVSGHHSDDFAEAMTRANDYAEYVTTAGYNGTSRQHFLPNPNKSLYRTSMAKRRKRPYDIGATRLNNTQMQHNTPPPRFEPEMNNLEKQVGRHVDQPVNVAVSHNEMESVVRSVGQSVTLNSSVEVRQLDQFDRFGATVADVCRRLPPHLFIRARSEVTNLLCKLEEESLKLDECTKEHEQSDGHNV